ncbi:MAG: hypothetical protein QOD41_5087 [Cryptosporangiaceae bacterium]|nr:hypothetical protein [Cryptosporangiaceae bacterium]
MAEHGPPTRTRAPPRRCLPGATDGGPPLERWPGGRDGLNGGWLNEIRNQLVLFRHPESGLGKPLPGLAQPRHTTVGGRTPTGEREDTALWCRRQAG